VEDGGLARAVHGRAAETAGRQRRARVGWHGAWEQGRRGGPGAWVAVGEHGPVALGWPEGTISFVNYSKNIQTSLN
jgi:hypothetical protein